MPETDDSLDLLVDAVTSSAKYRNVSQDLVRAIGAQELAKGVSRKMAVKATKNKLHQVGAAYQVKQIDFARALDRLQTADSAAELQQVCRDIMGAHASTRERLPILEDFFSTCLGNIVPPRSVIDIACGLNPLARSWMPLADNVSYHAYDIYADMMQFLQDYMGLAKINGRAEVRDVIHTPPRETADLALLLKTLPCLEQIERGASARLLDALQARYLLVSYPVSSLGGRQKGMVATYDTQFAALAAGRPWVTRRFLFETELAFLVDTLDTRENHVAER
jgi:16S rRNA (guanine(1405)-N(7))-methyltransferase